MFGALFGHGHMGRIHAMKLREHQEAGTISGFVVVDPPCGLDPVLPALDFAIIATPTTTHAALALPLLSAGVPCLIEKPLAASLVDATALAAFPHLAVGHVERFNPALPVGVRPRFFEAQRLSPFSARGTDVDVIADLMIHDIDLALSMLGNDIRDVRAIGVGVLTGSADIVNARIEIGDAVASLSASRVSAAPVRTLRLVEPGLYWSADLRTRRLTRVRWGEGELTPEPVVVPQRDPIFAEQAAFFAAVRGEAPYICTGPDALAALTLAERIRDAL
ncbi:MAG: putative dehydrogenase [Myxococcota bacterium]|jgi:predicted dehydrogenase